MFLEGYKVGTSRNELDPTFQEVANTCAQTSTMREVGRANERNTDVVIFRNLADQSQDRALE